MDNSTENVTLLAGYVSDVIDTVKELGHATEGLEAILAGFPLENPYKQIPMEIYNNACNWVENELGEKNVIEVGKKIGARAYDILVDNHIITPDANVIEIMEGIEIAASTTIQDPKERGWELLTQTETSIVMRRTQTFNSRLQFGLLERLAERCPTVEKDSVSIKYLQEVVKGADFDEYEVTWKYTI